jgi:hypothetical protein
MKHLQMGRFSPLAAAPDPIIFSKLPLLERFALKGPIFELGCRLNSLLRELIQKGIYLS